MPAALAAAMLEDVVDLAAEMPQVDGSAVVCTRPGGAATAHAVVWPGMPVLELAADAGIADVIAVVAARLEASHVVVVAADAPDLPPLLVGKLFSALTGAGVAVCPAAEGGLVAVGAGVPVPAWLAGAGVDVDAPDALTLLRRHAPARSLVVGPGWHRVRSVPAALQLDPELEGWEATRRWRDGAV